MSTAPTITSTVRQALQERRTGAGLDSVIGPVVVIETASVLARCVCLIIQTPSQIIASPSGMPNGGSSDWKPSSPPITIATQMARGKTPARRLEMPNSAQPIANSR